MAGLSNGVNFFFGQSGFATGFFFLGIIAERKGRKVDGDSTL